MCFRNLTGRVFLKRRVKGIFGKIIQSILKNKLKKKKKAQDILERRLRGTQTTPLTSKNFPPALSLIGGYAEATSRPTSVGVSELLAEKQTHHSNLGTSKISISTPLISAGL